MTKKFLICWCLTLSAVIFNFGLGMGANQLEELPAREAVPKNYHGRSS